MMKHFSIKVLRQILTILFFPDRRGPATCLHSNFRFEATKWKLLSSTRPLQTGSPWHGLIINSSAKLVEVKIIRHVNEYMKDSFNTYLVGEELRKKYDVLEQKMIFLNKSWNRKKVLQELLCHEQLSFYYRSSWSFVCTPVSFLCNFWNYARFQGGYRWCRVSILEKLL